MKKKLVFVKIPNKDYVIYFSNSANTVGTIRQLDEPQEHILILYRDSRFLYESHITQIIDFMKKLNKQKKGK